MNGSNHEERTVNSPEKFDTNRYVGRVEGLSYQEEYEIIAQGDEKFREMYRCAGEWITLYSIRVLSDHLVNKHEFTIPDKDWELPINQFPTYP